VLLRFLYALPQFIADDLQLRVRDSAPFALRSRASHALICSGHLHEPITVSDHLSRVEIAAKHPGPHHGSQSALMKYVGEFFPSTATGSGAAGSGADVGRR
jgi:hypothetical protein